MVDWLARLIGADPLTAAGAIAAVVGAAGLALLIWADRRRYVAPGLCRKCRYDLTGNVSGRCPECGAEIRDEDW